MQQKYKVCLWYLEGSAQRLLFILLFILLLFFFYQFYSYFYIIFFIIFFILYFSRKFYVFLLFYCFHINYFSYHNYYFYYSYYYSKTNPKKTSAFKYRSTTLRLADRFIITIKITIITTKIAIKTIKKL